MDLTPETPTGAEFLAFVAPYLFTAVVLGSLGLYLRRSVRRTVARKISPILFFASVGLIGLLAFGLVYPHNHGHIAWTSDTTDAQDHAGEVAFGLALFACCAWVVRVWRRGESKRAR